ncbi:hypothetical protein OS493_013854 [Desmophyllum pertusum]|uniref:Uncharacterized protein n=1 Tax=Desmophyllum pertusum TaxID=174260 RepID=A0A9W9ZQV7_9CNID|nr:hypothetical protein OS493_013854 [Desmophyllum pertusum]
MGGLFDQSQLSAMAVSSSYVLNAASFRGLTDIRGSVSSLISQVGGISIRGSVKGTSGKFVPFLVLILYLRKRLELV